MAVRSKTEAATLFDLADPLPDGFRYQPGFISAEDERGLLDHIRALEFGDVRMHGVVARRRIVQYGRNYSFDSARVSAGPEIPELLRPLRDRIAAFAGRAPNEFSELLVTEYPPGAAIGWHRDAPPFGIVAGLSLLSACRFRLRRQDRTGPVLTVTVEPRSLYIIEGAARSEWQHHIPPTPALRYSLTLRTLRRGQV